MVGAMRLQSRGFQQSRLLRPSGRVEVGQNPVFRELIGPRGSMGYGGNYA
jgi:hypothetical protein